MIKVSVLYPHDEGAEFDMDYYLNRHMPMVQDKVGPALKGLAVEQGLAGGAPDTPPAYVAMGHLYFESTADFQDNFGPHTDEIMGDIPNFTPIQPTVQISEVKM